MATLHLHCDLREPSLSRAVHEARRLRSHDVQITHIRSRTLAENLLHLAESMERRDAGMIFLLHARQKQRDEAAEALARIPGSIASRITVSCSPYSPGMRKWVEQHGLAYDENIYEAPRKRDWKPPTNPSAVTLAERNWIQYRLMRVLIAGKNPADSYADIVETLRNGTLSSAQRQRGEHFFEHGEPDMAGGQYAEERRKAPNAIDLLRERAVQVGRSGLNTLIVGETGTGKESLAWYLHDFSLRGDKPLLALNCAFFEGERLESELFGHEQGAFTDAKKAKKGLVEEAHCGTLFLDELPEMAPRVQAKLLRFLQDGSYTRLGGTKRMRADVRIISAAQPERLVSLRRDLYYRVADVELHTVPLREMAGRDVVNIACNLAYRLMWQPVISARGESVMTPDIIRKTWERLALPRNAEALAAYDWPGNMRELSNAVKRLVLLGDDIFGELPVAGGRQGANTPQAVRILDQELKRLLTPVTCLDDLEQRSLSLKELPGAYIRHIVASLGGRDAIQPTKLAEALGCSYNTLVSHLDHTTGKKNREP